MSTRPSLDNNLFQFGGNGDGGSSSFGKDPAAAATAAAVAAQIATQSSHSDASMLLFQNSNFFYEAFGDMAGLIDSSTTDTLVPAAEQSMFAPPSALPSDGVGVVGDVGGVGNADGICCADGASGADESTPTDGDSADANVPGGGPQPIDAFSQPGGGTLTEFTRRKNWPAKVIEELCDLLQIIEPSGHIKFTSPNITSILGYTPEEAVGQSLSDLVHPDDRFVFLSELSACIANASILRLYTRLRKKDGTHAIVETVGHAHIAAPRFAPNPANQSPFCQAVFLVSRPYPTKNAHLLDSFLEHKMENERLRRRINDLRREEACEDQDDQSLSLTTQSVGMQQNADGQADSVALLSDYNGNGGPSYDRVNSHGNGSGSSTMLFRAGYGGLDGGSMRPPPMGPPSMGMPSAMALALGGFSNNIALTRENLEGIAARPVDSLIDKMARYEGMPGGSGNGNGVGGVGGRGSGGGSASSVVGGGPGTKTGGSGQHTVTPADTIEMLTGLRYQEGERSRGLSTGNRSPRLIKGDAGIAFTVNRDQRSSDKKKKIRLAEEYVCTDCGTLESPEWRKGPSGPKTLCNACGLRWAKKEKKEKKEKNAAADGSLPLG